MALFVKILRILARFSFWLMVILLPFRTRLVILARPFPPVYQDYTDFLLFAADAFMLLTIFFWIIAQVIDPIKINLGPWFISLPVLGLAFVGLVSTITSVDPALTFYHAVRLILLSFLYVYVLNEIVTPLNIVIPVALMVAIQGVICVSQVLAQHSIGLIMIGELELDPNWEGVSVFSAAGTRWLRAYGLSDHPNILGGILAFGLLIIFASILSQVKQKQLILTGCFIVGVTGLFLTFSRSAWLAVFTGLSVLVFYLIINHQRENLYKIGALFLTAGIVILPFIIHFLPGLTNRLVFTAQAEQNPQELQSIGERALLNQSTNELFAQHALLGIGLGALPVAMQINYPDFPLNYQPAHLVLLDVAAETGIIGASLYGVLMVTPWLAIWINRKNLKISIDLVVASMLLVASLVIGFLDYYTWLLVPGRLWQWIIWGLWVGSYQKAQNEFNDS